jgi:Zn-dependent peptidase ImmA (M78 family)
MLMQHDSTETIRRFQQTPPVDVAGLALALGLNVYADQLADGIAGMIIHRPEYGSRSGYSIVVNARDPLVRQRFTVAHEIAHFVLHKECIGNGLTENAMHRAEGLSNWQEVEANKMAADILMPVDLVSAEIGAGNRNLETLAAKFNVSQIAMAIRLGIQA